MACRRPPQRCSTDTVLLLSILERGLRRAPQSVVDAEQIAVVDPTVGHLEVGEDRPQGTTV
jgi:hypothetical protein